MISSASGSAIVRARRDREERRRIVADLPGCAPTERSARS